MARPRTHATPRRLGKKARYRPGLESLEDRTLLVCNALVKDIVDGIDFKPLADALQNVQGVGARLPFVGKKLADLNPGKVVTDLQTKIKDKLIEVGDEKLPEAEAAIKQALGTAGINVVKDVRLKSINNGDGAAVEVDLLYEKKVADESFNIGLDGLPIRIDNGMVQVKLGIGYDNLRIVLPNCGDPAGTHLDFSQGATFHVSLGASLEGTKVSGSLGFLAMEAADAGTMFKARLAFNLADPGGNGAPDLSGASLTTEVSDVKLQLSLGFADGNAITPDGPSVTGLLHIGWDFNNETSLNQVDASFGEAPLVEVRDVSLKLGTYVTETLGPVIKEIQKAIDPVMPLVNILTEPIPVVSDLVGEVTLLDVAQFAGGKAAPEYQALIDLAAVLVEIANIVGDIQNVDENATIPLTDRIVISDPQNKIREKHPDFGNILKKDWSYLQAEAPIVNNVQEEIKKLCPDDQPDDNVKSPCENLNGMIDKFKNSLAETIDVSFPFFEDPLGAVAGLLLGQDSDLVSFTAQFAAAAETTYADIPLGPVSIELGGMIAVEAKLRLAYDTFGFRKAIETGDAAHLVDGFYLDTSPAGAFPAGPTRFVISGGLSAKVSLDYVLVEAGIEGGLFATFALTLDQSNNNPGIDGDPAKLRPFTSELGSCVLQTDGGVYAFLNVFLKLGIDPFSVEWTESLAEERLIDLGSTCSNPFAPPAMLKLASMTADDNTIPAGQLRLNIGPHSLARNLQGDPAAADFEPNEVYEVRPVKGEPESVVVSGFGYSQTFTGVTSIFGDGGSGKDNITIKKGVAAAVTLRGGAGDDRLAALGDGTTVLEGGGGDDILAAGGGRATLMGGSGNDVLKGGARTSTLKGGTGDDRITGGMGPDSRSLIEGEDGNDKLTAGPNGDVIRGGPGDDVIASGKGGDLITGDAGNDNVTWDVTHAPPQVDGGQGTDNIGVFGTKNPDTFVLSKNAADSRLKVDAPGGKTLLAQNFEEVNVDGLDGADTITMHSLRGLRILNVGINLSDNLDADGKTDVIKLFGTKHNGLYEVDSEQVKIQKIDSDNFVEGGAMKFTMIDVSDKETYVVRAMNLADAITFDADDGVAASNGNDVVNIRGVTGPTTLLGSGGNDTFTVFAAKPGNPNNPADPQDPKDYITELHIDAGKGINKLQVNESASEIADDIVITDNRIMSKLLPGVNFTATGGNFRGGVMVGGGAFDDHLFLQSTLPGVATTVHGGGGDDQITVASGQNLLAAAGQSLDGIRGPAAIDAGAGANNELRLIDTSGQTANANVLVTSQKVTGLAGPANESSIAYKAAGGQLKLRIDASDNPGQAEAFTIQNPNAALELNLAGGDEMVRVQAISQPAEIDTGLGDHQVLVRGTDGTVNAIQGPLKVNGLFGATLLQVDDALDTTPDTMTLAEAAAGTGHILGAGASDTFFGTGGSLTYSFVSELAICMGKGNDRAVVQATAAGTMTTIAGGLGNDLLTGSAGDDLFTLEGPNAGTLEPGGTGIITFSSFENLNGAAGADTFLILPEGSLAKMLDGGADTGDTLDYSPFETSIVVNLQKNTAPAVAGFTRIEAAMGGQDLDTLIGQDSTNRFHVEGVDEGVVKVGLDFQFAFV